MKMDFSRTALTRLVFLSSLLIVQSASAGLIQIIHTNDLHSHFEHGENPQRGHYGAVKAVIDKIKYAAYDKGLETLVVDTGDFSEGTQFFLADRGEQSWKAMNMLGYDAVVIGNHDYLMGQKDLDRIVRNVKPDFFLLGANFHAEKQYSSLYKAMQPRARLERNGDSITVMGLTTDEYMYTWRAGKGAISAPKAIVNAIVPKYRKDSDFVIALTHLGLEADKKLIRETKGIDLVIGGHSHHALAQPVIEYASDKRPVPIVQAGEHGEYVGSLLVDLTPGKPARVVHYELVPVHIDGPRDTEVSGFVAEARKRLESTYPLSWLYDQIGYSEVPLTPPRQGKSVWGDIVGKGMLLVTKADIAFNAADLFGDDLPAGAITRERLIQFYPRVFEFSNFSTGWTVWTAEVEGWVLKYFMQDSVRQGFDVAVTNASFTISGKKGNESIENFKIGNSSVKTFRTYKVAMPEGIGRLLANDYSYSKMLAPIQSAKVSMWAAIELQLRKTNGIVQ